MEKPLDTNELKECSGLCIIMLKGAVVVLLEHLGVGVHKKIKKIT